MRIVTRPDFDGVVCAAIISGVEPVTEPILWVEPNDMQNGRVEIREGDIVANLPFDGRCSMWFDHHYTNKVEEAFEGAYYMAPSAAGIVYDYYRERGKSDAGYAELIRQADKIDSADLTMEEVRRPEAFDHVLLSMTISNRDGGDAAYWNRLVELLRDKTIAEVMADDEVARRCREVVAENERFRDILMEHTRMEGNVSITDLRPFGDAPNGNRFLSYALFPESCVSVKIRYKDASRERIILSVGHSIFNRTCNVNVGLLLSGFNGGGHPGAGSCSFPPELADEYIPKILGALAENKPNA